MSIGKSVPNLISYLHEFFQNFSQSPPIYFELISFGINFNSEITDKRAPLVSHRAPRRARTAAHRCCVAATRHADSAALSRCRDRAPHVPTASPALRAASRRVPTASPAPPNRCLARAAVVPTARAPTAAVRSRVAWTAAGRLAVARRRRRFAAVSAPVSRRSRRLPCAGAEPWAVGRADAAGVGHAHRASWPRAISAQLHPVNFINF
jgi:hypothetical protein